MYIALNLKIEQMSEFLDFFLSKVAIAGFLPPALLLTLVNYFVFDLGAESFYLPAPMLCVPILHFNTNSLV